MLTFGAVSTSFFLRNGDHILRQNDVDSIVCFNCELLSSATVPLKLGSNESAGIELASGNGFDNESRDRCLRNVNVVYERPINPWLVLGCTRRSVAHHTMNSVLGMQR